MGGIGYGNLFPKEPWMGRTIQALLALKGGAFVDVGVNIGRTLLKFIEYGDGRLYYGFEPRNQYPSCRALRQKLGRRVVFAA